MRRVFAILGLIVLALGSGAAGPVVVSVALSNITGLGTNVATFLAAALTTNGALKLNGSGTPSQAASTDLSDTTAATTWTAADASPATLTFTSVTGNFSKGNKTCAGTFRLTYPTTANSSAASVTLPCTVANNGNVNIGSCWTTSATAVNSLLAFLGTANSATANFINTTGGATSPLNSTLSTLVVSCSFSFITT